MKQNKIIIGIVAIGVILLIFAGLTAKPGAQMLAGTAFTDAYHSTPQAQMIDVRTPAEFAAGHLAGATNIDLQSSTFANQIQSLDKTKPYFVYCHSGNRSAQAVTLMKKDGFTNITELTGGIAGNPSLQLVTDAQTSMETHASTSMAYFVDSSDMLDETTIVQGIATSTLTTPEIQGLLQMREEEKLAHDVYITLGTKWNLRVFGNIAASEQTHAEAMKVLLDTYGIADPVGTNGVGVFTSPTLQKLYTDLVSQGSQSLTAALTVGATVEDLDIRDLSTLMQQTKQTDILLTYENLQKGSRNHLRAFTKNLAAQGTNYTPQYISATEYRSIISTPQERGSITTLQ